MGYEFLAVSNLWPTGGSVCVLCYVLGPGIHPCRCRHGLHVRTDSSTGDASACLDELEGLTDVAGAVEVHREVQDDDD